MPSKGDFGSVKTITWTNATTTDVTPDTDYAIDLRMADYCTIQVDTTDTDNTCTSTDINVWASMDNSTWDTAAVWDGQDGINDNKVQSFAVTLGPAFIRLRLDANNGRADVTAKVYVGRKK